MKKKKLSSSGTNLRPSWPMFFSAMSSRTKTTSASTAAPGRWGRRPCSCAIGQARDHDHDERGQREEHEVLREEAAGTGSRARGASAPRPGCRGPRRHPRARRPAPHASAAGDACCPAACAGAGSRGALRAVRPRASRPGRRRRSLAHLHRGSGPLPLQDRDLEDQEERRSTRAATEPAAPWAGPGDHSTPPRPPPASRPSSRPSLRAPHP